MEPEPQKEISTIHSEHLTNGERPIMACVEGYDDETSMRSADIKQMISEAEKSWEVKNVDYKDSFSISPLSTDNKVSEGYIMCTGVAGVGKDKWTDENISFLSHQFPGLVLPGEALHKKFISDLHTRLEDLKEGCVPGSVDIVIVGGEYNSGFARYENRYVDSIDLLKNEVSNVFGFDPVVITGPKLPTDSLSHNTELVLLDTKERRLYISRPKTGNASSESFMPGDIETQREKWNEHAEKSGA
ncbi:MAG: hypothetical protein WCT49_01225 [Candidatus Paceibacterota bacterium]|nr:hypothetical protein [Candidatus Paceibacterota bacterium]